MQTIILCGGLGTRLREETEFRPKPMVNIGSRPILWHIMKIYSYYGHQDFILPLGYKGEVIREYFYHYEIMNNDVTIELGKQKSCCLHNSHDESGWKITLADTGARTLKGGRIKRVEKFIKGDTFLMTYGDGLSNININRLIDFHKEHGKIATLIGVNPAARFGELRVEGNSVRCFNEKPTDASRGLANGGFFVLNRRIFDFLEDNENCDFEYGALESLAELGELMVYRHSGFWTCMDTIRDTELLNKVWAENKAEWKIW